MIQLQFEEPDCDDWKAWRRQCRLECEAVIERVRNGEEPQLGDLYKDARMQAVYKQDGPPFYGKCAYCEGRIGSTQPGDIEHYRPKGRVTHENRSPVMVTAKGGRKVPHPGYYWLAYEWTNLLYACSDCNRINTKQYGGQPVGKGARFPVEGKHATEPGEEKKERPLLLNPMVDKPDEHLSIDRTGIITEKSKRGQVTIRILGLNIREALITDRLKAIEDTQNALLAFVAALGNNSPDAPKKLNYLSKVRSGALPFALACRFALKKGMRRYKPLFHLAHGGD